MRSRQLRFERLEARDLLCGATDQPCDFASAAWDMNQDGLVTPADVVWVVNYLNYDTAPFPDDRVSPLLALQIINDLNLYGPHAVPGPVIEWIYDAEPIAVHPGNQVLLALDSYVPSGRGTTGTISFTLPATVTDVRLTTVAGIDAGTPELCVDGDFATYTFHPSLSGTLSWELIGTVPASRTVDILVDWSRC